jgi:hypothetical protein
VVLAEVGFATAAPVHFWKTWPVEAAFAAIETIALAAKEPPPDPLTTVSVYSAVC